MRVHSLLFLTAVATASSIPYVKRELAISKTLPDSWSYLGCYLDSVGDRQLSSSSYFDGSGMTQESCVAYCNAKGYSYAGVEYSQECYCGTTTGDAWTKEPDSDCNMACSGDATEACGGPNRLTVFMSSAVSAPAIKPISGWTSQGCYTDNVNARTLSNRVNVAGSLTAEACAAACGKANFVYAGVEYSTECYCDNVIRNGATAASGCTMTCAGDQSELCGGPSRLNLYKSNATPPTPAPIPSGWAAVSPSNCFPDSTSGRTLPYIGRIPTQNVTVEGCINYCNSIPARFAGVEYGQECYCGDYLYASPATDGQAGCNMPCTGNTAETCGGPNRLNVYSSIITTTTTTTLASPTTVLTETPTYACSPTATSYGVVQNGGFEKTLDPWTYKVVLAKYRVGLSTGFYEGCSSLSVLPIQVDEYLTKQINITQTLTGLVAGKQYTFSMWAGLPDNSTRPTSNPQLNVYLGTKRIATSVFCQYCYPNPGGGNSNGWGQYAGDKFTFAGGDQTLNVQLTTQDGKPGQEWLLDQIQVLPV